MSVSERIINSPNGLHRIVKVSEHILLFEYENQDALCRALLRPEEFYESPEFRNKIFTLGQFRQWYSERYGAWTYYQDWSGFNIPSYAFTPFISGLFDPLAAAELEVVDLVRFKTEKFCVIGTYKGCEADVYEHEICHALFATNDQYKMEVLKCLKGHPLIELKKALKEEGYDDSVILDECHAYICASSTWLDDNEIPYSKELQKRLQKIRLNISE